MKDKEIKEENKHTKLEDKILTSKNGKDFIFPAYDINTQEKLIAKIDEYSLKIAEAVVSGDTKALNKSKKMLELLKTQKFSSYSGDCQSFYIENGFTEEPERSPEERTEIKKNRNRQLKRPYISKRFS